MVMAIGDDAAARQLWQQGYSHCGGEGIWRLQHDDVTVTTTMVRQ